MIAREVVPAAELDALRALAKESGTTWGEAVIACYAAFLHRMQGQRDVVFAVPLMCRLGGAALRTPAMAVNVLPPRVTVRGGYRLPELTQRVAGAMREMRAHQRYRGENIPQDVAVPGAGGLLHGCGINLKAFDVSIDFASAKGVLRNVALALPRSADLVVAPLAVLDAGAAYLALDVDHPKERLRELVADARPKLVLSASKVALLSPDASKATLLTSQLADELAALPDGPLSPAELAAHTYSFAFDASLDQLVWLLAGHELHLYDGDTARDAEALVAAVGRDGIDVVDTTRRWLCRCSLPAC